MTEGSIGKSIVKFAMPLFLGNLFQQLYNTVDSLVVGKHLGKEALAAVSSSGSLIFLLVGFIQGIFIGAGVIISKYYGAKDYEKVHTAIHTTVAFGLAAGLVLTVFGVISTPFLLRLMGTPEDVIDSSITYFRIYFYGGLGIVLYNTTGSIFRAVGDSKSPLNYLIISSIVNIVLDILFVVVIDMGVGGAALATGISQLLSALLGFVKLTRSTGVEKIVLKDIRADMTMLKGVLRLGIPSGVQNSVISIANVVVQSNINAFESSAIAGCGSYFKLEGFVFIPVTSFSMALTTFIGQNLGAHKEDRVKKGARFGILTGVLLAEIVGVIMFIFAPSLISIFNKTPEVVAYGTQQARIEALFYCLLSLSHCMAGVLRGAGKTKVPMIVMLAFWCVFRIIYITSMTHFLNDIRVIFWGYPLTWSLSAIAFTIYYFKADWMKGFWKKYE